jgi:DNA-binding MarR family transcriptional regulator
MKGSSQQALAAAAIDLAFTVLGQVRACVRSMDGAPTLAQLRVLRRVAGDCQTGAEIAEDLGLTPAAVSRMVEGLVERGYVARQAAGAGGDRRRVGLQVTSAGAKALRQARQAIEQHLAGRFATVPDGEASRAAASLRTLAEVLALRIEVPA